MGSQANNTDFLYPIVHVQDEDDDNDSDDNKKKKKKDVKFPAQGGNRYAMYVSAGCPFAARPWAVQALYGLPITIIKMFPAAHEDGWFFKAISEGEKALVLGFPSANTAHKDPLHYDDDDDDSNNMVIIHHLRQLYQKANPNFTGTISVPLVWDTVQDTAVNNSSLQSAELFGTEMKHLAIRNQQVELYPRKDTIEYKEHDELIRYLHSNVTTAVYKINVTNEGHERETMIDEYYKILTELQTRLQSNHNKNDDDDSASSCKYLMGSQFRFADIILWISLIRHDLAYQWRFGMGKYSIREDFKGLWNYMIHIHTTFPDMYQESVLPRDIMAMYFMGTKFLAKYHGGHVPHVPRALEAAWNKTTMETIDQKKDDEEVERAAKRSRVE